MFRFDFTAFPIYKQLYNYWLFGEISYNQMKSTKVPASSTSNFPINEKKVLHV
jgi:hypothetical protein